LRDTMTQRMILRETMTQRMKRGIMRARFRVIILVTMRVGMKIHIYSGGKEIGASLMMCKEYFNPTYTGSKVMQCHMVQGAPMHPFTCTVRSSLQACTSDQTLKYIPSELLYSSYSSVYIFLAYCH
jgi:hypothetical protein